VPVSFRGVSRQNRSIAKFAIAALLLVVLAETGCATILRSPDKCGLSPKQVVLTFDDGPDPYAGVSEKLLATLDSHGVKAMFCVVGKHVDKKPELVREYVRRGHSIANHGYHHLYPLLTTPGKQKEEIALCDKAIGKALGIENYRSTLYRPPFGFMPRGLKKELERGGVRIEPITFYVKDSGTAPRGCAKVEGKILERIKKDGRAMIVLHECNATSKGGAAVEDPKSHYNRSWIPVFVDKMIVELKQEGYEFVTYN
jgi:peptidoglycan/xylan/chitin deacetylase (PgdA/CDA1 family)